MKNGLGKSISNLKTKTKIQLEQPRFEGRKLEPELQMEELKTKHHLLEEQRELERKVKRIALKSEDVRSQSTNAPEKSCLNSISQKRDVTDWVSRIDNPLTPDRSTARFALKQPLKCTGLVSSNDIAVHATFHLEVFPELF